MGIADVQALLGIAEILFGVFYAFLGTGPDLPNVPRWMRAFLRLIAPLPLFLISMTQLSYAPEVPA